MKAAAKYEVGQVFERWTPFVVEAKEIHWLDRDSDGSRTIQNWRPGIRNEPVYPDDARPVWDGDGAEIRRIVSIAKIDGGGIRILYRRTWRRPDGGEFGKARVRMTTPGAFTSWLRHSNSSIKDIRY